MQPTALIPFKEVCKRLGIAVRTGYNWIQLEKFPLPLVRRGHLYVRSDLLEAHLNPEASKTPVAWTPMPQPKPGRPRRQPIV